MLRRSTKTRKDEESKLEVVDIKDDIKDILDKKEPKE
jgi:hypothetical protein